MSLPAYFSFEKLIRPFSGKPISAPATKPNLQPGNIYPNFAMQSDTAQIRFWDWAEGSWVYIFLLPDSFSECADGLFSYAIASAALAAAGVKTLAVSGLPQDHLDGLAADLEAIVGCPLNTTLVSDRDGQFAQQRGLQVHENDMRQPVYRSFLIGPDLRVKRITVSGSRVIRTAYETLQLVSAMQHDPAPQSLQPARRDQSQSPKFVSFEMANNPLMNL